MTPEIVALSEHRPLHIVAHLRDGVLVTFDKIAHIDGILAGELFRRQMPAEWGGVPPAVGEFPFEPELPLARWRFDCPGNHCSLYDSGGFLWGWCGSAMHANWIGYGRHQVRRPMPVAAFSRWGHQDSMVNSALGVTKAWDKTYPTAIATDLHFYAVGDADAVRDVLSSVHGIGKLRNQGRGAVSHWTVNVIERAPWDIFDGRPMRSLPDKWPGIGEHHNRSYVTVRAPYWQHHRQILGFPPSTFVRS